AAAALGWSHWGAGRDRAERIERVEFAMHTVVRILAEGSDPEPAVDAALAEIERLSGLFDRFDPHSPVSRVNRSGPEWTSVDEDVLFLLQEARRLAEMTDGAFDPTVAPLVDLWGFVEEPVSSADGSMAALPEGLAPPDPVEIARVLESVGYGQLEIDRQEGRVRLNGGGGRLDVGGIAKGYAATLAARVMERRGGVSGAIVSVGGDMAVLGARGDGSPWRLGIRHPRRPSEIIGVIAVSDAAVSTSGDYERYFEHEGERYAHILDPRTGRPARRLASVTVVAGE